MVDLGSLVLLMSIFGWKIAIAYVLFGLVIAVVGGTIIEKLHLENEVADFIKNGKSNEVSEEKISQKERLNLALRSVFETLKKVFPYIIAGVAIGAFIHNWIPQNWIETVLGKNNPLGVVLATVLGAPMYADIFGCIPIAESLLVKGAMLGVVLSFMMAVTTLSLPSLVMLKKVVKGKLLFVFIAICVIGIILVGYLFNALQVLFI
ncbi:putative permease [Treponema vincentii ATCC 35580]|uniref:Putative permease n=1 Tax=Treponema vincentii ATCC 35580 TaxID=596324 RepID=C8PP25_9SPIR|nr:putative permease [Treponema vincentii ATCC 35580]